MPKAEAKPDSIATKKVNVALQGGGSHGAVVWGALDALLADGRLEFEAVSGASAGSVNAAALASGLLNGGAEGARESLERVWRAVSDKGAPFGPVIRNYPGSAFGAALAHAWFDAVTRAFSPYQFNPFDINPLRDLLEEEIDFKAISKSVSPRLFVAATNVRTGRVKIFENAEITVDAVCASACLPMIFKAVEIDGEHYWDGGYMGNPVLYPFFYQSASSDIIIVHVNPIERDETPTSAEAIVERVNEITFNSSLLRELRAIDFVRRLIEEGMLKEDAKMRLRNIRVHSVRSDKGAMRFGAATKYDVDWGFLNELKEEGAKAAREFLDAHFDAVGVRSSVDIRKMFEGE
jgi:NTE family protein